MGHIWGPQKKFTERLRRVSGNINMLWGKKSNMFKKTCFMKLPGWYVIQNIILIYLACINNFLVGGKKEVEFKQPPISLI